MVKRYVGVDEVKEVVSKLSGVPVEKIKESEADKLLKLEKKLKENLIGQDENIEKIVKFLKRARLGLNDPNKPLGSFLFLGPTGVGKTETAKILAKEFFDNEKALIRIDMSELMEGHSVSKLIGSPPGYVGYEEGGVLTQKVKKNPYSIILFDEIEKANRRVLNILLQILDEGFLRDSKGEKINFRNTLIILTSNLGFNNFFKEEKLGFVERGDDKDVVKDNDDLRKYLSPEFLNRLDLILNFNKLSKKDSLKVAKNELKKIEKRLADKNIKIKIKDEDLEKIVFDREYNFDYGARPLKRILEEKIVDKLVDEILNLKEPEGVFEIKVNKAGEIKIQNKKRKRSSMISSNTTNSGVYSN